MKPITLGILGTGNMAQAILWGVLNKKFLKPQNIIGFDIDSQKLKSLSQKTKIKTATNLKELFQISSVILLATKPQQMGELLKTIQPFLKDQLILTIAAGLDLAFYKKYLGSKACIIRLMPNTPALLGKGATVFFAAPSVKSTQKKWTQELFRSVGSVYEVKKENLLDAVTALSGSGPAFVYRFTQALTKAGIQAGLPAELAQNLALDTVLGAATLQDQSEDSLDTLIQKVTSKGGTTEAGLLSLSQNHFETIIEKCINAAKNRAFELRKK